MSAISTVDIHCDLPGCYRQELGEVSEGRGDLTAARATVRRKRWRTRVVPLADGTRRKLDLCPAHGDITTDSLAAALDKRT
mgnify:CR=1 FL=1